MKFILTSLAMALCLISFGQSEGPNNSAQTAPPELDFGGGTISWSAGGGNDATANDNNHITTALAAGEISEYMVFDDFSFSIPGGRTADQIVFNISRQKSAGSLQDHDIRLVVNGVIVGNNLSLNEAWPGSEEIYTLTTTPVEWGISLSDTDINTANFGIAIAVENAAGGGPARTASVDHVDFTISYSAPLPISLESFTAHLLEDRSVSLEWTTLMEKDNDFFTIEKSKNGLTFETLDESPGAGDSNSPIDYEMIDNEPFEGVSYYRLKQTDFDGKFTYSEIVAINYETQIDGSCVLKVYPNPCYGDCTVSLDDCKDQENSVIQVEVLDAAGNLIVQHIPQRDMNGGFNMSINRSNNLTPGIYIVKASSVKEYYNKKLLVK